MSEGKGTIPEGGRVLVVDDDEVSRALLEASLGRHGLTVTGVGGGNEALRALAEGSFDLVLLDVVMPDVTGLEVLERIRREHDVADLPAIMVTAKDSSEDVVAALRLGANDYVTKPFDMSVVLARVETQLGLKRSRDQVERLNRQLEKAQERIHGLLESSPEAAQDIASWARSVAAEVARTIGAREIAIWTLEGGELRPVDETRVEEPDEESIRRLEGGGRRVDREHDTLFPVLGMTGELFGILGVAKRKPALDRVGQRLVMSFARQLGGALELRKVRDDLDRSERQRRETQQSLLEQGVTLVRLCPECGRCYGHETERCEVGDVALDPPLSFPWVISDRYRLVRALGEGGMGTVFEARDGRLDREVAIKVINPKWCDDKTVRARFEREARAVARIDHPGVVAVFDCGELADGSTFILMERLRGIDLHSLIAGQGRGRPSQVAELLRQGGAALGAAHRAGLVHRDIKPGNIILVPGAKPEEFRVKVLDFGVVKELAAETDLTTTGGLVGTPRFMSPEQAQSLPVDARSDIYSFAAVCYLALAGRPVSLAESFLPILLDIVQNDPPRLSSLLDGVPEEVDDAFAWALAKSPDARPATIEEWVSSVADFLDQIPSDVDGWSLGGVVGPTYKPPRHRDGADAQSTVRVDDGQPTVSATTRKER